MPSVRVKAWFKIDGADEDGAYERTLQEQLIGLRPLIDEVKAAKARGKPLRVLDLGCGEGLISFELARLGAIRCHGVEIVPQRVRDAKRLRGSLPCSFEINKVDYYEPKVHYDVVMGLSILHKMPNPSSTLAGWVRPSGASIVVLRLPPKAADRPGHVIVDRRSAFQPHDCDKVLAGLGYRLHEQTVGPRDEWCGLWRFMG